MAGPNGPNNQNDNRKRPSLGFIGIVVFVGYLLLKRPIVECIGGFIKTAVGFMILSVGSNGLINTFRPILTGLNMKYELNAAVVDPYFGLNAAVTDRATENTVIDTCPSVPL